MEVETVWQFKEVLDRLLDIVTLSVQQSLCLEKVTHSDQLVNNCCQLLAKVIAELAAQARGIDVSISCTIQIGYGTVVLYRTNTNT